MKSSRLGTTVSPAEVTNIDSHGIWLLVQDKECFLSYEDYPWFKNARLTDVLAVELHHHSHLRWDALDVDLCIESLQNPEGFPLIYK
jgi:hypothetical protein